MLDYQFDFSAASELERAPATGINVLIVGGGPGGLFAALQCYRKGHNVRVLEAARGYGLNGGYVRIGSSIVDHVDVFPGLAEAFKLMDHQSAWVIYNNDGELLKGPFTRGDKFAGMSVHRSALSRCLYEYALALGIDIERHTRAVAYYEDDEKAGCITKEGQRFEADLVIAADGISSHSQDLVPTEGSHAVKSSNVAIFRATVPAKEIYEKVPDIKQMFRMPSENNSNFGGLIFMIAQKGYGVCFADDELINFNINHPDTGDASERWDHNTTKDEVLAYLEDDSYAQAMVDAVRAAPDDAFFNWRLMFRNPTPNWVSRRGHIVQLGDAAHTYLPSSGNGATQAMEDAVCLAACLQLAGKSQVFLGVRAYNKLRFQRTSCIQKVGFRNRLRTMGWNALTNRANVGPEIGTWISKHDPEAHAYEKYGLCVNHLLTGADFEVGNLPPGHVYRSWVMDDFLGGDEHLEEETGDWS